MGDQAPEWPGMTAVVIDAECMPEARQDGGQRLEWSAKPNACWAA